MELVFGKTCFRKTCFVSLILPSNLGKIFLNKDVTSQKGNSTSDGQTWDVSPSVVPLQPL